ncbi:MAG: M48 family metalloprotease [Candidatus Korarchaeota archaeon]|nr:M48 family metalloprotease [Candidatus Korarchaeota archaeon]
MTRALGALAALSPLAATIGLALYFRNAWAAAFLGSLAAAGAAWSVLSGRLASGQLRDFVDPPPEGLSRELESLRSALGAGQEVELGVLRDDEPNSLTLFLGPGKYLVLVTGGMLRLLTPDEVRAVLAHEVAHVAGRHPLLRVFAAVEGVLNIPLGTLLGAAVCRWLEFRADEEGAMASGRPLDLASALVKVAMAYRGGLPESPRAVRWTVKSLLLAASDRRGRLGSLRRAFSWHPGVEERVARLIEMARRSAGEGAPAPKSAPPLPAEG